MLLAHVDHGKTSILDKIRESSVAAKESGGITQAISAYQISLDKIKEIGGELINKVGVDLTIPGLLFIDSPGHEAFTTFRKRGGSIADIAIVVIDINDGEKPQTREVIEILKNSKTPFVIAVNKIDMLTGWRSNPDLPIIKNIAEQSDTVGLHFERKLYEIVAAISAHGINSDRFDRVDDYTKKVAMIPISAKTGEGFPELLMILSGLAQKYLEESLKINVEGQAKGTILEVCEEKGVGKVLDAIIYDGTVKVNDTILIGVCEGEPIKTKVKCLFNLDKGKVVEEKEVHAAAAVKISASELDEVIPGMPIRVCNKDEEKIREELKSEIEEVEIETDNEGIIVKADTLGSLEALTALLRAKDVKIKKAKVGAINKQDIAEANSELNDLNKVIVGFNVKVLEQNKEVKIITNDIIYKIIDDVTDWIENFGRVLEEKDLEGLIKPFKIEVMKNHIFRISNPAVVGVDILAGTVRSNTPVTKDGRKFCELKEIQDSGKNIGEAKVGKEVAVSFPGVMCGRQLKEGDILYSNIPESDFRKLKKLKKYLKDDEIQALKEIAELKRKDNPTWGI